MDADALLGRPETLALIAVGGFAGANLRYGFALWLPALPATLAANVLGCFLLGTVRYESLRVGVVSPATRTVVATGFLSSLTTYSAFALQSAGAPPPVLVGNVLANYALGGAAVLAGRALVGGVWGASR